jgi:hypothetical protein
MPDESVVDQMAADAAPPVEYPPGTPELVEIKHVRPRQRRADVKREFKKFQVVQEKLDGFRSAGVFDELDESAEEKPADPGLPEQRIEASAVLDEMLQTMDDVLGMCASDPAAYQRWSAEADDDLLSTVFGVWSARSQPGEASSSSS